MKHKETRFTERVFAFGLYFENYFIMYICYRKGLVMSKERTWAIDNVKKRMPLVRNRYAIPDFDAARLYGVSLQQLRTAVRKNKKLFPRDFIFKLTRDEFKNLKTEYESSGMGKLKAAPMVFTKRGFSMLSSVLKSKRASDVNITIMREFVRMQDMPETGNAQLPEKENLESRVSRNENALQNIFHVMQGLIESAGQSRTKTGYKLHREKHKDK